MSLVTIEQAAQPLWEVGLVALGGAVVGGGFTMLGGWRERRAASKARVEERKALLDMEHAARQRQIAEQLIREIITLLDTVADVEASVQGVYTAREIGASQDRVFAALQEYNAAYPPHNRAWLNALGTMTLVDDDALRAKVKSVIDRAVARAGECMIKPTPPGSPPAAAPPKLPDSDPADARAVGQLITLLGKAARHR